MYRVAVSSYEDNRLEAAVGELEEALKADPENAEAHNMLGIIALRQGAVHVGQTETMDCLAGEDAALVRQDAIRRFREAEGHFRKSVELRDDFPEAWNNLAVAALNLREWDVAIDAALKALRSPTYAEPHVARGNLGWAYFNKKDVQRAWKELHEAVSRQPRFCVGRYRLAKVFVERKNFDDAAENLAALVSDKTCPIQEAFLLGGMVEQKRGRSDDAVELFRRCQTMAPKSCVADECRRLASMIQ
jgi:tetratricopeptide (TPR) repeat protein